MRVARSFLYLMPALHCPKGGYPIIRHNEVRDLFAELMRKTCYDIEVEPHLKPLSNESLKPATCKDEEARLDISAKGLWCSRFKKSYYDVKVFNPFAPTNRRIGIKESYKFHERTKKTKYLDRIVEVEHSSFIPLIFSTTGGSGPGSTIVIKRLASRIGEKTKDSYPNVINFIRTSLSFALLRSTILCIRGHRGQRSYKEESSPCAFNAEVNP